MQWNPLTEVYDEEALIVAPDSSGDNPGGYSIANIDMAIGNEISVAWDYRFSAYTWDGFNYVQLGATWTGHGTDNTYDCFVGDYDNDDSNEIILADDPSTSTNPEITVLKWDKAGYFVEEASYNHPGNVVTPMAWVEDVDEDNENEIVCVPGYDLIVLDWDGSSFTATTIDTFSYETYACVCGDTNNNGVPDIAVGLYSPSGYIYEWDGDSYEQIYSNTWTGEESVIEAVAIGDSDSDGFNEVAFGTDVVHILQWCTDCVGYVEEAVLPTHGMLAPLNIGDCDSDGENEVNVGNVDGAPYEQWVYKHQHSSQPTCFITSPLDGSSVSGIITIEGLAYDDDIVETVYVRVGDSSWQEATLANETEWSISWDMSTLEDGWHTIYAGAFNGQRYSALDTIDVLMGEYVIDPDQSFVTLTGLGLTTCPAGDGPAYNHVKVTVIDTGGQPIEGISAGDFDFTVTAAPGTGYFGTLSCTFTAVDAETDANGEIRFQVTGDTSIAALSGFGAGAITIEAEVQTIALNDSDDLPCCSYDENLDGKVDLSDFSWFAVDFGLNRPRSDYDWDGGVDLSDFAQFAVHFGHS